MQFLLFIGIILFVMFRIHKYKGITNFDILLHTLAYSLPLSYTYGTKNFDSVLAVLIISTVSLCLGLKKNEKNIK